MSPKHHSTKWYSKKLKSKLEQGVNQLDEENTIISRVHEGNIYHLTGYVVKERMGIGGPKRVVFREYMIGTRLNYYKAPHMVKTCGYMETPQSSRLVVKLIKGVTLSKYLRSASHHEAVKMMVHIVMILGYLQQEYQFCHYGLHSSNIIIEELKTTKRFSYKIGSSNYSITTRYNPVIIDLGRSYMRGVPAMMYEGERIELMTTPGIFDGQIDYAYILWSVKRYISLPRSCQMLVDNQVMKIEDGSYKLNRGRMKHLPKRLIRDDSLWSGKDSYYGHPDDILDDYNSRKSSREETLKKLGNYCNYKKRENLANRRYSDKEIFKAIIKELDSIK